MQNATYTAHAANTAAARRWRPIAAFCASWCVAVCAAAEPAIYLLGEIHDNPEGHALRLEQIAEIVRSAPQPVIAMEEVESQASHPNALPRLAQACRQLFSVTAMPEWLAREKGLI